MNKLLNLTLSVAFMMSALLIPSRVWAQQQTIIGGKLLGHDGNTLIKAHVHLIRPNQSKPVTSVEVAKDDAFQITTAETGLFLIQFTGVNHLMREVPIYIEQPAEVKLQVQLRAYEYMSDLGGAKIIGDFNGFSFQSAMPMQKQTDGTYAVEFETSASKFVYQLVGVAKSGGSINGTDSEDYVYDGGGDYRSVVSPKNGRVRIIFDPKKLVRAETKARVHFNDPNSREAKFALLYDEMLKRRQAFSAAFAAHKRTNKPAYEFSYDWSSHLSNLSKQIAEEEDALLRQLLLFSYLDLGFGTYGAKLDSVLTQKALAEIPPISRFWTLEPDLIGVALSNSGQPEKYADYVRQIIEDHPDQNIKARARKQFSPDRNIMVGKIVPAFSFTSLDNPTTTYTNESLRGKIYLIDFWATWCKPCIEEMENMHRVYEKYKTRGFEIVSLSLDDKPETIKRFRSGRWRMPWLNSLIPGGFDSEMVKRFEISGIPKPILVGRTGKIIAIENELRGPNLDKTLAMILTKEK